MADKVNNAVDAIVESDVKEKESPKKDDNVSDNVEKENGEVCDEKNGKTEATDDDVNSKETDDTCPVKRKSAGGDVTEDSHTEGASPEKKAKLDNASSDVESNGEAEVAA